MGRVAFILQACLQALDDEGERKVMRDVLVYHMNAVQRDIIRRAHAMRETKTISLRSGKVSYNVGGGVMEVLDVDYPKAWQSGFEITQSIQLWNETVKRTHRNPVLGIFWNPDVLEITPAPGSDSDTLTLRVLPEPDVIDLTTDDPDVSQDYDKALRLGTLAEINADYMPQYEAELAKQMNLHLTQGGPIKVNTVYDELGF